MLSICIPVFNVDVRPLVQQLANQIAHAGAPSEIIVIDDASKQAFKQINQELESLATYIELPHNIGRSAIRNRFLEVAKQPFLLYLDCDAEIISEDFIQKYINFLRESSPEVVVGASIYQKEIPDKLHRLRWYYSVNRESKSIEQRLKFPDLGFKTNNFIIQKSLLEKIRFDERLKNYGHEDTLLGFQLKERNIPIQHIDNPVRNKILDSNERFLEKTKEGIDSLVKIIGFDIPVQSFIRQVKLLSFYKKIQSNVFLWIAFKSAFPFFSFAKRILLKGNTNLYLFDFYKLVLLHHALKKSNSLDRIQ